MRHKILLFAQRDWALNVANDIAGVVPDVQIFKSLDEVSFVESANQTVIFLGWGDLIPNEFIKKHRPLGVHPSDLPEYRGGSPLQNQIIDGVLTTKNTLFQISSELDAGDVILKVPLHLGGDCMSEVLRKVQLSTFHLICRYYDERESLKSKKQGKSSIGNCYRLKEEDRSVNIRDVGNYTLKEIYDKARASSEPYPSFYLFDDNGQRLYISVKEFTRSP